MRAPSLSPQNSLTSLTASLVSGRSLIIARIGWGAVAAACLALFIVALPLRLTELRRLVATTATPHVGALAISTTLFVACAFALEVSGSLVFFALSLLLFLRRSEASGVIHISALLLAFGAALPGTAYAIISATPIWRVTPGLLQTLGWTALLLFAYLFPTGEWIPRWSRWVAPLWLLWTASFFAFAQALLSQHPILIAVSYLVWIAWLGSGVCAQVYRYLWVATPPQRQQSKWVLLGFIGALVGILLVSAQQIVALSQGHQVETNALFIIAALVIVTLAALPIPLSITIAILRHNLFDIDRLINLTLVYGALTITLGAIYAAAVGLSQLLMQALTGSHDESQLALVISTLGAAALFQPLRRRIQHAIDRQFYRRRYDAATITAAFAASLRTELDLNELSQRLAEAAYRAMKPQHISLWLAEPQAPATAEPDAAPVHPLDDLAPPAGSA